ncbi:MAG: sulfide/dihydroorotate dehydrogenase-like FAD/NAD-binding protein [Elusimicrobiota bacterium]|jgi:ferredoxin--NADP+ reductase
MHKILRKEQLNAGITLLEFEAKEIAEAARAGQFIILRIDERGERFPLTLFDFNPQKGTITVVCQAAGVSTRKLSSLNPGDSILDVAGPLGHAVDIDSMGRVIMIGGGVGTAEAYPIAKALQKSGKEATAIIGARTKDLLICEKEIREVCRTTYFTTDDGSYGRKGFVTDVLQELLDKGSYDVVFAIGPVPMMKKVSEVTRLKAVKTLVSLNSIMIDGTGMCGGCRIQLNGEPKFTCVDGPEFDGHAVDFADLTRRLQQYKEQEKRSLDRYEEQCRIGLNQNQATPPR